MIALLRTCAWGGIIIWAWLDWMSATPTPIALAILVSWWGARGITKALEP